MLFREVPPKVLFLSVYHRHFLECIAPHFSVICFQNQVSCGFYSQDTSLEDALVHPGKDESRYRDTGLPYKHSESLPPFPEADRGSGRKDVSGNCSGSPRSIPTRYLYQ